MLIYVYICRVYMLVAQAREVYRGLHRRLAQGEPPG